MEQLGTLVIYTYVSFCTTYRKHTSKKVVLSRVDGLTHSMAKQEVEQFRDENQHLDVHSSWTVVDYL